MIEVSREDARRIAVRAQALDGSADGVLETIRRLGSVQMDPISTVAPAQHMVLFSRLGPYDVAELDRLLWEDRQLFEWSAFIWPIEDLPLVRALAAHRRRSRNAWSREFLQANAAFRRHVLRELDRNGAMLSRDLKADLMTRPERHRWWGTRQVTLMLEMLHRGGRVAVAGRVGKQRLWDLSERVWPESETLPWRVAKPLLDERRRRSFGAWLEQGKWMAHPDVSADPVPDRAVLLSPFDRLVNDRDRAEALWDFRYRLEMYVPKPKRQYGYYVLPLLVGDELVGRAEPVFEAKTRTLRVLGEWGDTSRLDDAIEELGAWLGAASIER